MFKGLLSVFGTKTTLYAMLATAVLIAGMYGYIRYQGAVNARQKLELSQSKEETRQRDERIEVLNRETDQFVARVREVNAALDRFQVQVARNTKQRQADYTSMTGPAPTAGQPADTSALEQRANTGMNGAFDNINDLTAIREEKK